MMRLTFSDLQSAFMGVRNDHPGRVHGNGGTSPKLRRRRHRVRFANQPSATANFATEIGEMRERRESKNRKNVLKVRRVA